MTSEEGVSLSMMDSKLKGVFSLFNSKENPVPEIEESKKLDEPPEAHKNNPVTVSETVCLQADITIKPIISVGRITTSCGDPKIGKCCKPLCSHDHCNFSVSQEICVQIPLNFSTETIVDPAGHVCGVPEIAPCHKC